MDVCIIVSDALSLRHRHLYCRRQLAVNNNRSDLRTAKDDHVSSVSVYTLNSRLWTVPPDCSTLPATVSAVPYSLTYLLTYLLTYSLPCGPLRAMASIITDPIFLCPLPSVAIFFLSSWIQRIAATYN